MKVYPELKKKVKPEDEDIKLNKTEVITRWIALAAVVITVYFFFFKILFF